MTVRGQVRRALERAGGVPAGGTVHEARPRAILRPFGDGRLLETDADRPIPVGPAAFAPDGVGFLAGVQRYVLDGHVELTPVVRAWVAAGVLERREGALRCVVRQGEEFLVVPAGRLGKEQRAPFDEAGLPVVGCDSADRPHPLLDRWAAVRAIDTRRATCERAAADRFLRAHAEAPLVVDGPAAGFADLGGARRVIATIREHETLFLEGRALATALTLPAGHRSGVFLLEGRGGGAETYSWYLRLWPWTDDDLLHGLIRIERTGAPDWAGDADRISRWLLGERTPIAGTGPRWDRVFYPMHEVETYLRAHAGGWR